MLALPALWLAACFVPAFMASIPYRIVLSSGLVASLLAMAAVEFWRGRSEQLPSRWPVVVIFASGSGQLGLGTVLPGAPRAYVQAAVSPVSRPGQPG